MSTQPPAPKIRLNLPPKSSSTVEQPATKKAKYNPQASVRPVHSAAHNLRLLHQKTSLSFVHGHDSEWYACGYTTLYVVDEAELLQSAPNSPLILQLALHCRATCQVQNVKVESISKKDIATISETSSSFQHLDPLERVLLQPAGTFVSDQNPSDTCRHQADYQSTRGSTGMTNALRAASIASNMGELRISSVFQPLEIDSSTITDEQRRTILNCWTKDLNAPLREDLGEATKDLRREALDRASKRKSRRISNVSELLTKASVSKSSRALKIHVAYRLPIHKNMHFGGVHAPYSKHTPHVYTTTGVYGDHEGPRCWIPTLDSASTNHRSSHEIAIQVTASMREGLSVLGFGEDFGLSKTYLHEFFGNDEDKATAADLLGKQHLALLAETISSAPELSAPHIIQPDSGQTFLPMNQVLATTVWFSSCWLPVPARSLGFAIGPFRVLEDSEYFDEDGDFGSLREKRENQETLKIARRKGEGIRHAYIAPCFVRQHIHGMADSRLLPDTVIRPSALTSSQIATLKSLDETVLSVSNGVPHRALSLMRDILAVPAFRTVQFTQIWLPEAVHGGASSGALTECPEVLLNPFLGGSIMDSKILPPAGHRLPFHHGGRVLQFLQARNAVRSWIISALPLGGRDDIGQGYLHTVVESFIMSLYERGHGAYGEGGAKGYAFFAKRYAQSSGLNSSNLEFLPVQNIEDLDLDIIVGGIVGAVPMEDRNNDQLWRSSTNGTESHTSAMDECAVRDMLCRDIVAVLERGTDKDRAVPLPSMGWLGSHLSLSFLSSNATSSSDIGCGSLELVHPIGGTVYRALKGNLFRQIVEGRAGINNLTRVIRAAFVAAHLDDTGKKELQYPPSKSHGEKQTPKPRFIDCVNQILNRKGLSHTLFTRVLQLICGRTREAHLLGSLVDVERLSKDPRTGRPFLDPEGFPNSFVRGASELYLRVGVHVEPPREGVGPVGQPTAAVYVEPVIPEGGIAFGGPITLRVVENEGQFREYVKEIAADGSRRDWGGVTLHAKPVTTPKAQTAASGIIERTASKETPVENQKGSDKSPRQVLAHTGGQGAFNEAEVHRGGYQAIELIRLTNLTPLLWIRVDPGSLYGGQIYVFQPDACLAEQLFHDGDSSAQIQALRSLSERPIRIQGSVKVTSIYDVPVSELPVRVMGDCLRGSASMASSLPHTPVVRAQAALCVAQWQNNKAPANSNVGTSHWTGLRVLLQYFRERFYNSDQVMPVKFTRVCLKKVIEGHHQASAQTDGGASNAKQNEDDNFTYLDTFEEGAERAAVLEEADEIDFEEDEEYRVRSSVVTAISSIRAKDGQTPKVSVRFLEAALESIETEVGGNIVSPDEDVSLISEMAEGSSNVDAGPGASGSNSMHERLAPRLRLPYVSSILIADTLLALCNINTSPALVTDPKTGKPVQSKASHPVSKLMQLARRWLDWELYREGIRLENELHVRSGMGGGCYAPIAACAVVGLSSLAILRQVTTDPIIEATEMEKEENSTPKGAGADSLLDEAASSEFYAKIFDRQPARSDVIRAACAQAVACICSAADRFEESDRSPDGLLTALEFMLDRIVEPTTSVGLRHTLALLMMDACTGKICSTHRVGTIGGRNDLVSSAARYFCGPLGASGGGDNGSAVFSVNATFSPSANAVNDGARRGLRLLSRAGLPKETGISDELVVRIARFATRLWRTVNGEALDLKPSQSGLYKGYVGVCANDAHLRCSLLSLMQWIWPKGCYAVVQVQFHRDNPVYLKLGIDEVMMSSTEEKDFTTAEESSLVGMSELVNIELDRQRWRGEMATKAYEARKSPNSGPQESGASEQGVGAPLPTIQRDAAFKAGGWVASTAQQRRAMNLDGGIAVTKFRLRKSGD